MDVLAEVVEEVPDHRDATEVLQDNDEDGHHQRGTDDATEASENATDEGAPDLAPGGANKVDVILDHELFHGLAQLLVIDPGGAHLRLGFRLAETKHLALARLVVLEPLGLVLG